MKIECTIIEDLLPLYSDKVCSKESAELVEEHLTECDKCKKKIEEIKSEVQIPEIEIKDNLKPQKTINRYTHQIGFITGSILIFLSSFLFFWVIFFIRAYAWVNLADKVANVLQVLLFILLFFMLISSICTVVSLFERSKTAISNNLSKKIIIGFFISLIIISILWGYLSGVLTISLVFILALSIFIALYFILKLKTKKQKKQVQSASFEKRDNTFKKTMTVITLVFLLGGHFYLLHNFSDFGYQTGGLTQIISKGEIEKTYYFVIPGSEEQGTVTINCSKEIYNTLIVDENVLYTIEYRWLSFDKEHGVLETIDTQDIIDNRK